MPTASTSARPLGSTYSKPDPTKRTSLYSGRSTSHYSTSALTGSSYTSEALNRPLPSPLTRSSRAIKSDFVVKPRMSTLNTTGPIRAEHAKYSAMKNLYDSSSRIYDSPNTTKTLYDKPNVQNSTRSIYDSGSLKNRYDVSGTVGDSRIGGYTRQRNSQLDADSYYSTTDKSWGHVSPSTNRNYVKDSVDELLLGRTSRTRISTNDNDRIHSTESRTHQDDDMDTIIKSVSQVYCNRNIDNQSANSNIREVTRSSLAESTVDRGQSSSTGGGNHLSEQYQNGGKVGLKNLGNTCFMNSILQIVSNTRILLEYCLQNQYKSDISRRSASLMSSYADLIRHLWTDMSCVSPNSFKSQIQRFAPRFMGYQQQDAQEFLRYLLEGLHEDVNRVTTRQKPYTQNSDEDDQLSDSDKAKEYWRRYLRRDDSKIVEIFVGQLRSELKFSCGHRSVTFDPFWDLSVSIPRVSGDVSIIDCVTQFMRDEELDPAETPTCSKCKARKSCRKGFSIQKFPQILVLHLKRFSQEMFRRKLNTQVDFPTTLDLAKFAADSGCSNTTYSLYGVCNHSGGTHSGHYTAYSQHPYTKNWYCYNDSRVSSARSSDIVSSEAYVLFYELTPTT